MRSILAVLAACAAAGCAAQPSESLTYADTAAPEATTLEEAQKLGYKVVDQDGQVLYCREWRKLGSHIQKERLCMTEQELRQARTQQQRTFDLMKAAPPLPKGN